MTKRLQVLILLIIAFYNSKSQDVTKESIQQNLLQRWKYCYVNVSGTRVVPEADVPVLIYEYHSDSSIYCYANNDLVDKSGKWSFDEVKKVINIQLRAHNIGSITFISKDSMKLTITPSGVSPDGKETYMQFAPGSVKLNKPNPFTKIAPSSAQIAVTKLDDRDIPKNIKYTGNIFQAVRWTDSVGDNIVILTLTDRVQSKNGLGDAYTDRALYAYHYLVLGDSIKQEWKIYDYVKDCMVDMFLYYVNNSFAITDLNNDGKAEVWIMYKVSCQGDVSPVPMKIIMYQDDKKFAVRGTTNSIGDGGNFSFDEAFKNGPPEFRQYAEKLWNENKIEKWGQEESDKKTK